MSDSKFNSDWKSLQWKSSPTWDPVILPRSFKHNIRNIKLQLNTYITILSDSTEVEIWSYESGQLILSHNFHEFITNIDFIHLVIGKFKNTFVLIIANQDGDIVTVDHNCNFVSSTNVKSITKCFIHDKVDNIETVIIISDRILIKNYMKLENTLYESQPMFNIEALLALDNEIIFSSYLTLWKGSIILQSTPSFVKINQQHKTVIWDILNINSTYLLSICFKEIKVWKKPSFICMRYIEIPNNNYDDNNENLSQCYAFVHNERFLFLMLHRSFYVYDCITGFMVTKATDAHTSNIVTMNYLDSFNVLQTVSEDGIIRFWAFQVTCPNCDLTSKLKYSPKSPKNLNFTFDKILSYEKSSCILGSCFNKLEKTMNPISCLLQLRTSHQIKHSEQFVNLDKMGFIMIDSNNCVIFYRNREYSISKLMRVFVV